MLRPNYLTGLRISVVVWVAATLSVACSPHPAALHLSQLTGTTLDHQQLDASLAKSRVLVVSVFGSWCAPCIDEADGFGAAFDQYRNQGVRFVGLAEREISRRNVARFVKAHHIRYPVLYDQDGNLALRVAPTASIPTTLIFRRGELLYRIPGAVKYTTLAADIRAALV